MIRALYSRNYRLFFTGQSISLIGSWMQRIAISWLVYRLTGSAVMLGAVNFVSEIPFTLAVPFAGVFIDRLDRHRVVVITQICAMAQASILAALVLTNRAELWHLFVLGATAGLIQAFDNPARQSLISAMVEKKEDLGNAIALNSSIFNLARLVGPSLAGVIIAVAGEGICFLINAVSFIPVLG